jgi:hypothetical protein
LLRTSDHALSAEDVALGYKQLHPVYHDLERRTRAHVLLCGLALLLARLAETATEDTWRYTCRGAPAHVRELSGPAGRTCQRTEATPARLRSSTSSGIKQTPRFVDLSPQAPTA